MSCERSGADRSLAQLWNQARPGEQSHGLPDRSRLHSGDKWDRDTILNAAELHIVHTAKSNQFCLAKCFFLMAQIDFKLCATICQNWSWFFGLVYFVEFETC